MADNIKDQLIAEFRSEDDLTPGVVEFLSAAIPDPPEITTPADVDAAIIANGLAAKYVLDLFKPFAGLTPVEMVLHIGQLNTVLQGAYLAGLEYIQTSNAQQNFAIVYPEDGRVCYPGNVRLQAKDVNGTLLQCAVEIDGHAPVALDGESGSFYGFIRLDTAGTYTITFYGLYDQDLTISQSVDLEISADAQPDPFDPAEPDADAPQQPDGNDLNTLTAAKGVFDTLAQRLVSNASDAAINAVAGAAGDVVRTGKGFLPQAAKNAVAAAVESGIQKLLTHLSGQRGIRGIDVPTDVLTLDLGTLMSTTNTYVAAVSAYFNRDHPAGGYTTCPAALQGASQAMNDKYGSGTVVW
jgi:hypothetical protein